MDKGKVKKLNQGKSYIRQIKLAAIRQLNKKGFIATSNYSKLKDADCILICVPTPINDKREPDLSYIKETTCQISKYLRKGRLISLESTTYPGTTREVLLPEFRRNGLKEGKDFFLVFSPERENPGSSRYNMKNVPKVLGGITSNCTKAGEALYRQIVDKVIALSSPEEAEFTKLLENIFRSVNIALVNELKILADRMGIDIWKVIKAASSKPFGFMPFSPGPGLGGHCIPIDPFYLSWKAKEFNFNTRFIELAGEINTEMPGYVVSKTGDALNRQNKCFRNSKILILGVSYKKDVDDTRESPAMEIIKLLKGRQARVFYNDPYVPSISGLRKYKFSLKSIPLTEKLLQNMDAALIITGHSCYDYEWIVKNSKLIIDTRNAAQGVVSGRQKIIKA